MTTLIDCYNDFKVTSKKDYYICDDGEGDIKFEINEKLNDIYIECHINKIDYPFALTNLILYILKDTTKTICFPLGYDYLHYNGINPKTANYNGYTIKCYFGDAILVHESITYKQFLEDRMKKENWIYYT
jgi:hypothetical protein